MFRVADKVEEDTGIALGVLNLGRIHWKSLN